MEKSDVNLFSDDGKQAVLPSSPTEVNSSEKYLVSDSIVDAISGSEVKTIIIPEVSNIEYPNYVFDFTEYSSITVFQKESLKNLITKGGGDTALYLLNRKTLTKFGTGTSYKLENMIVLTKRHVFSDDIKVYRDLRQDGTCTEVTTRDITKQRLNL